MKLVRREKHPFFQAIWNNEIARVEEFLASDPSLIHMRDTGMDGDAALHNTCSVEMARLLLRSGADPNARDNNSQTPIFVYIVLNTDLLKFMLEQGADPNTADYRGRTPLHLAHRPEVAEILIRAGANVNARDVKGRTPAWWARKLNDEPIFRKLQKVLQEHGGIIEEVPDIFELIEKDQIDAVRNYLTSQPHQIHVHSDFLTYLPIHKVKSVAMAQLLLSFGADINAHGHMGMTPIYDALKLGDEGDDLVEFLLKNGADPHAIRDAGYAPLHFVRTVRQAELLLDYGAKINHVDGWGQTPLARFLGKENEEIFRFLESKGGKVEEHPGIAGKTLLHDYSWSGEAEVVEYLLRQGFDPNRESEYGEVPLHLAIHSKEKCRLLLEYGARPEHATAKVCSPLSLAFKEGQIEVANLMLESMRSRGVGVAPDKNSRFSTARTAPNGKYLIVVGQLGFIGLYDPIQKKVRSYVSVPGVVSGLDLDESALSRLWYYVKPGGMFALNSLGDWKTPDSQSLDYHIDDPHFNPEHSFRPGYLAVSPSGRYLAMEMGFETVRLWDLNDHIHWDLGGGEGGGAIAFNDDESEVAVSINCQGGTSVSISSIPSLRSQFPDGLSRRPWETDSEDSWFSGPGDDNLISHLEYLRGGSRMLIYISSDSGHSDKPEGWRGSILIYDLEKKGYLWSVSHDAKLTDDPRIICDIGFPMGYYTTPCVLKSGAIAVGGTRGSVVLLDGETGKVQEKCRVRKKGKSSVQGSIRSLHELDSGLWALTEEGEILKVPLKKSSK